MREDEQVERRIPERAYVSLLDAAGVDDSSRASRAGSRSAARRGATSASSSAVRLALTLERSDHKLSLGPMTLPAPARPRRPARAALPRPQDPRRRAVPPLTLATPIDDLRAARGVRAAAEPRDAGAPPTRLDARAPAQGRASATTRRTPRCCWRRPLRPPPREVAEQLAEALGARLGDRARARRGRRPGLPQPVPGRRVVRGGARATSWPPATPGAAAVAEQRRARARRVRLRQPDRARCTAASGAQRRLRRRARAPARASPATRSRASTTSTTPARRSSKLGESIRARARGEEPPEDGYQGDYVAELAAQIDRRRRSAGRRSWRVAGVAADDRARSRRRSSASA